MIEALQQFASVFLHLDTVMGSVIQQYGVWTEVLLFLIIFCETGLIVTPFLPGDSLLFAAGTFAALGVLPLPVTLVVILVAAILGDTVNYEVGRIFGMKAFTKLEGRILTRQHLERTQAFYAKHGGRTIILARFIPIIRTLAPFVAGIGQMPYKKFIHNNIIGAVAWVMIFVLGGYFFGTIPIVKQNFTLAIMGMIAVSLLPLVYEMVRGKKNQAA